MTYLLEGINCEIQKKKWKYNWLIKSIFLKKDYKYLYLLDVEVSRIGIG